VTRDALQPTAYFVDFIQKQTERSDKFHAKLDAGEVAAAQQQVVLNKAFELRLTTAIAKYSAGAPIAEIKQDVASLLDGGLHLYDLNTRYDFTVWMLSLCILCDIADEHFDTLVARVERDDLQDWLVDFLIQSRRSGRALSQAVKSPVAYGSLIAVLQEPVSPATIPALQAHQESWLANHRKAKSGWVNFHKQTTTASYYGYWSFETAAVAKILGLDASLFATSEHFPADLV